MRNSTGSPLFSDFKSDLSRVVRSRPLVKGNEDAGYEGDAANEREIIYACAFACEGLRPSNKKTK